jgi:hypothetical protein
VGHGQNVSLRSARARSSSSEVNQLLQAGLVVAPSYQDGKVLGHAGTPTPIASVDGECVYALDAR